MYIWSIVHLYIRIVILWVICVPPPCLKGGDRLLCGDNVYCPFVYSECDILVPFYPLLFER